MYKRYSAEEEQLTS